MGYARDGFGGFWREFCRDEGFDLVPDARVVFDLDVRAHEGAGVPGKLVAVDVVFFVVELVVAEDVSSGGVFGANGAVTVEEAVEFIEVDGFGYVCGDAVVAFADL